MILIYCCSANILLDEAYKAKLGDFGFSVELPSVSSGQTLFTANFISRSEGYYPSEVCSGKISDRSDVYCFGVVSWVVMPKIFISMYFQVILETYSGLKAYDEERDDPKLVCTSI